MIILGILALVEKFNDPEGTAYVWFAVFVLPVNSSVNPLLYTFSTPKVGTQTQLRVNVSKNRRLSQNRGHTVQNSLISMKSSAIYFVPFGVNNMEEMNSRNLNFGLHDAIMQICRTPVQIVYSDFTIVNTGFKLKQKKVLSKDAFLTEKTLPSPCTAFSQSLSVNSLRFDHVTRNALAARNIEASGLGKGKLRFRLA